MRVNLSYIYVVQSAAFQLFIIVIRCWIRVENYVGINQAERHNRPLLEGNNSGWRRRARNYSKVQVTALQPFAAKRLINVEEGQQDKTPL